MDPIESQGTFEADQENLTKSAMTKKILLIGAGPTGALIAFNLKKLASKFNCPIEVHLWEKSRGTGGRFSTSRNPVNSSCYADLGAQYLTQTGSKSWSKPYFDSLVAAGLIRKFPASEIAGYKQKAYDDRENYVCVQGTASVVKHFLQNADVKVTCFNKRAAAINIQGNQLQVVPEGDENACDVFDAVISTMPVPQIFQLQSIDDILSKLDPTVKTNLESVEYTSRYALGLFYSEKLEPVPGEGVVNYVGNDPVVRYWTIESLKRSLGASSSSSDMSAVVVHTTVQFGKENVDNTIDQVKDIILDKVQGKFITLKGKTPDYIKCQKWRYSQVDIGYPGSPGFVELSSSPLLLAAGDGFVESGIEGCIFSAEKTVEHLIAVL